MTDEFGLPINGPGYRFGMFASRRVPLFKGGSNQGANEDLTRQQLSLQAKQFKQTMALQRAQLALASKPMKVDQPGGAAAELPGDTQGGGIAGALKRQRGLSRAVYSGEQWRSKLPSYTMGMAVAA